ncbi:MAG: DNA polymerase II large subunit [Nanoarchaeota archaeon]
MKNNQTMEKYFDLINNETLKCYELAQRARAKGHDPTKSVEVPLAKNMAERVVGIISNVAPQIKDSGVVARIIELEQLYGVQDWRVALILAEEVAAEKFCKFENKNQAMEVGIRIGLAYLTVGVVASPLEGFVKMEIKKRNDGKDYMAIYYSGPIRSAGGTASSASVIIADYIRKKAGLDVFDPTELEIKRMVTEIHDYHDKVTNLQYHPTDEELEFLIKRIPVQITGDPSEKFEVSNYKDLERMGTNKLRNGVALVIAECISLKAPKVWKQLSKWGSGFGLEHWKFIKDFVELQQKLKAKSKEKEASDELLAPDFSYIKDIVAGRPVLTHPLRVGGFRLRYGRCRNSGFSTDAINPATMVILKKYIAVGTQLKTERPGKSTVIAVCDRLEGPIVRLASGDVLLLNTEEEAKKHVSKIEEVIFLGDLLISYGDFLNRAHKLVPCGYNEEWHREELRKTGDSGVSKFLENPYQFVSAKESIELSKRLSVPLHPRYTYHWKDITITQLKTLIEWYTKKVASEDSVILPFSYSLVNDVEDKDPKRVLELLGVPHQVVSKEHVIISGDDGAAFSYCMDRLLDIEVQPNLNVLEILNKAVDIIVKDKSGTFIGARMGRPEKAKMRKLTGSPHMLFPVGSEGGKMRDFQAALVKGRVSADFPLRYCIKCDKKCVYDLCIDCGGISQQQYYCRQCDETSPKKCELHGDGVNYKFQQIDINKIFLDAIKKIGFDKYPKMIKGVRGMSNTNKEFEHFVKGVIRSKYNLFVNKDGTIRYDMTEMPLTHFKPCEIRTSVEKLKELGYDKDIYGKDVVDDDQIIELRCQDVILPACHNSLEEPSDDVLLRITKFIDELLVGLYGLEGYYNLKSKDELIGHLIVAMSPHTSAGIVGRVIGFSNTQGFLAHPLFHSIMRRDCDGDEACVILLLDVLLNFSRKFLPNHRGVTQDAPLVLTSCLIPKEVDDMVFDMDIVSSYPLELYYLAQDYKLPVEIKIKRLGDTLNTPEQYEGLMFTHDTTRIDQGVTCSAYKSIPSMMEKVRGQMEIAEQLRAVDEADVARLVIERHFMRDIKGNLRKFGMQEFRCVECNAKFRRPPLIGSCTVCHGKLLFTIAEGSIVKYLAPSLELVERYDLPVYLKQVLELTKMRIESIFGKDDEKQEALAKWF